VEYHLAGYQLITTDDIITRDAIFLKDVIPNTNKVFTMLISNNHILFLIRRLRFILLVLTLNFAAVQLKAQTPGNEDYKVYTAILEADIKGKARSVEIVKRNIDFHEKKQHTSFLTEKLTSADSNYYKQAYFYIQSGKGKWVAAIDSITVKCLAEYCSDSTENFVLDNKFDKRRKAILLDSLPDMSNDFRKNWKLFYEKYPHSAGIFNFSDVRYYLADKSICIVYYSRHQQALSAYGRIAILTKENGKWVIKYRVELWIS